MLKVLELVAAVLIETGIILTWANKLWITELTKEFYYSLYANKFEIPLTIGSAKYYKSISRLYIMEYGTQYITAKC